MLDARGLSLVSGNSVHRFPLLSGHGSYLDNWGFSDILETRNHRLIVAEHGAKESQLWEFFHHRWIPFSPALAGTPIHASYEDRTGILYFAGFDDLVVAVEGKHARRVPIVGGTVGNISALVEVHGHLFALGSEGAAVLIGDQFERLHFAVSEQAEMITGIVESVSGDFWINGQRGITRISSAEMQAALLNRQHPIVGSEVHEGDFVGPTLSGISSTSAVSDSRGILWFATLNGIVSLNTSALQEPVAPPELRIESADGDGRIFTDHSSLPPHVVTVRIRYIGLSLTKPEDVRYSYKLEGVDPDWQTVGSRTEAVYTGLRPAFYRFLVKASYGNDVWTQPAQFDFRIRSAFYQTVWFYSLCLLLAICLLATALVLRVQFLAKTVRERAEHRADERIRIARDLHDTLLQGVQGLMLTFHVAATSIPEDSHTRRLLERALQSADRLLVEGRTRVTELRGSSGLAGRLELAIALEEVGDELNAKGGKTFQTISYGRQVPIQPEVLAELFLVGREALSNAFRHSAATTIEITLQYEALKFTLICQDNGLGIPSIKDPLQTDRWGIKGMAERMERVGGTFLIEGRPGVGTRVLATLPARRVYLTTDGAAGFWARLLRRIRADDLSG
ncbi:MAG: ATP-binding protein [Janthinobacterium lividum]